MYNDEDSDWIGLTPNTRVFREENAFPAEEDPANIDENFMWKRQKYIVSYKKQYGKGGPKNTSKHSEKGMVWEEKQQCTKVSNQVTLSS